MPRQVHKTLLTESLDQFFSGTAEELRAAYRYSLDLLAEFEDRPLSDITAHIAATDPSQADTPSGPREVGSSDHFFNDWLSDGSPLDGRAVDRVFRHGYRTAIELAMEGDEPRPIETVWVSGESGDFEVHVVEGDRQVTVVVFVPLPTDELIGAGGQSAKLARNRSWAIYPADQVASDVEMLEEGEVSVLRRQVGDAPSSAS
jgi:hypothetical protein